MISSGEEAPLLGFLIACRGVVNGSCTHPHFYPGEAAIISQVPVFFFIVFYCSPSGASSLFASVCFG